MAREWGEGLNKGLMNFINAYQQTKQMTDERDFRNQQMQQGLLQQEAQAKRQGLLDAFDREKFEYAKQQDQAQMAFKEKELKQKGLMQRRGVLDPNGNPIDPIARAVEKEKALLAAKDDAKRLAAQVKLETAIKQLEDSDRPDDEKVSIGEGILKMLNDPENPDVVGAEEAERIGAYLKQFSLTRAGSTFGRDLPRFIRQVKNKKEALALTRQSLNPAMKTTQSAPKRPKTVTQNGQTYNLNEQTGEYE